MPSGYGEAEDDYNKTIGRIRDRVRPLLTDEFLSSLVEVARSGGWHAGDYIEIESFIQWCFNIIDRDSPKDLSPFYE